MQQMIEKTVLTKGFVLSHTYFTVRKPQHFFRIYRGFGISKAILADLYKRDVKDIVFEYHGIQNVTQYRINLTDFLLHGTDYNDETSAEDDEQIVCPITAMKLVRP